MSGHAGYTWADAVAVVRARAQLQVAMQQWTLIVQEAMTLGATQEDIDRAVALIDGTEG